MHRVVGDRPGGGRGVIFKGGPETRGEDQNCQVNEIKAYWFQIIPLYPL